MIVQLLRAWPRQFECPQLELPAGSRVADALSAAGWHGDGEVTGYAVYGLAVGLHTTLQHGDRVELLRPLQADPKDARRRRARARRPGN